MGGEAGGLTAAIDGYCERLGPGLWAEPLNAASNAAFVVAALIVWALARRAGRSDDWAVRALVAIEIAIGAGSFLFHTFAVRWAAAADVIPILIFILVYVHVATVRFVGAPRWAGALAAAAFVPASAALAAGVGAALGPLNGSAGYTPVVIVIVAYGAWLARAGHPAARGFFVGAALLAVSLAFRTLDDQTGALCAAFPAGTHWAWHLINGAMLGWMSLLVIRHGAPRRT